MTKKIWKSVFIISLAVMLIDMGIFITTILLTLQQPSVGIIGGADAPTTAYIMREIFTEWTYSPFLIVGALAFFLFVVSGIVLIYKKLYRGIN